MSIEQEIHRLADAIHEGAIVIAAALRQEIPNTIPTPGPFGEDRLISERQENGMDIHIREVDFPAVPAGKDVVRQHFVVTANGNEVTREAFDASVTMFGYEVPEDSSVVLSMVHEDNKGNMSAPMTQSFVSEDTLSPDAPGAFGEDRLIAERHEPDA